MRERLTAAADLTEKVIDGGFRSVLFARALTGWVGYLGKREAYAAFARTFGMASEEGALPTGILYDHLAGKGTKKDARNLRPRLKVLDVCKTTKPGKKYLTVLFLEAKILWGLGKRSGPLSFAQDVLKYVNRLD